MINLKIFVCNPYEENTIIANAQGSKEAVIIDPGCQAGKEFDAVKAYLGKEGLTPVAILLTHAHADHTCGIPLLKEIYDIPVYMDPLETPGISFEFTPVAGGQTLHLAGLDLEVISTPGHTQGGVCYLDSADKCLFSGDTLFAGTIGRTDLPGGDYDKLIVSIMDSLMGLDSDIEVFPGHAQSTSIAREKINNPFLQPFNEPEEEAAEEDLSPISISHS